MVCSDKEELADDEKLLDEVVGKQVFTFLQEAVIGCNGFHQEEYFVRRFHWLVTTFITTMPLKVHIYCMFVHPVNCDVYNIISQ